MLRNSKFLALFLFLNISFANAQGIGPGSSSSATPSGAAGGSLGGTYPNPTVVTNANLTGDVTSVGNATTLAAGSASNLNSGTLPAGRLPALTGDVTSSAGSAATTLAAGSASNLNSGTLLAARMPALTGAVTSSAGSTTTTLATQITNTVLGNATSGTASPTALAVGSCSTASSALIWTTNTGFGCNTSITASAIAVGGITGLGTGVATWLATPSSTNLASAVTGETGSGALVFGTAPSISGSTLSTVAAFDMSFDAGNETTGPTLYNSHADGFGLRVKFQSRRTDSGTAQDAGYLGSVGVGNWANAAAQNSRTTLGYVKAGSLVEGLSIYSMTEFTSATTTVATGAGDCGTSPSVSGNSTIGRVSVGTGTNGGKCTITFPVAFTNNPICTANNETTGVLVRSVIVSSSSVALTGVVVAGDNIGYHCIGYK